MSGISLQFGLGLTEGSFEGLQSQNTITVTALTTIRVLLLQLVVPNPTSGVSTTLGRAMWDED